MGRRPLVEHDELVGLLAGEVALPDEAAQPRPLVLVHRSEGIDVHAPTVVAHRPPAQLSVRRGTPGGSKPHTCP